ncbi:MAG: dicarboxylate/amino acid:cation symporter, partial [Alcanivorax sp.]|nr:dicarboxylate/amino acid:cation symporter [Alcanivorax sp.]
GLILVTDRLLDMCRTAVNVWGDSVGAVLLARSEGEEDVLRRPMRELDADPL